MLEVIQHDDVRRVRMWTRRSMLVGYDVSAYLVRGVLVDTGFRNVRRALTAAVAELRPRGIVVTHWHEDHAGNVPALAPAGVPIWLSEYTERKLREHEQMKLYRHVVWGRTAALRGAVVPFDPAPLQMIATPGHSADHHVAFDPETRTLFSGDLWLGIRVRVMGPYENPYEIVSSLSHALALEPRRMFDAHRGLVVNPSMALRAKRSWLQDMIGHVERAIDAGTPERVIVRTLLDGEEKTAVFSQGEYSRRNFVRAVKKHRGADSSLRSE
jgi:glyoxylase-like metal-dependent hydrolase (beta-lactamase superfamily II)